MGLDKEMFRDVGVSSSILKDVHEIRATVREAALDLNKLFSAFVENLTSIPQPKSVLEMVKCYEQPCDALIIAAKRQEGLHYVSGKLILAQADANHISCTAELYFQNAAGKWVSKKTSSGPLRTTHLTPEALTEVQRAGKVEFEVLDPEQP
ncbi:hypothetical protein [Massilia sp.]|uniref:hypothetical protein n=1 Tax=Massilia sp. TaxID=1882437 RepID=UPI0028A1BAB5|nr:hypothetical protein [Massilia sp.]